MFPVLLLAVSALLCLVLLAPLCVRCHRRPMRSISETHTSEDTYIPSTQFHVHRAGQISTNQNYALPPSNHLSPHISVDRTPCPTETESNNSYENAVSSDSDSDVCPVDPAYIEVIPETAPSVANDSRASTPSSDHPYVNVASASDDYLNVQTEPSSSDSSDDEGSYVNQPWCMIGPRLGSDRCGPQHQSGVARCMMGL